MRSLDAVLIPADGSACTLLRGLANASRAFCAALHGELMEQSRVAADTARAVGRGSPASKAVAEELLDWWSETVRVRGPEPGSIRYLVVDESGGLKGYPRNPTASRIYPGDIWGNALLVRGTYERDLRPANEADLRWVEEIRTGVK